MTGFYFCGTLNIAKNTEDGSTFSVFAYILYGVGDREMDNNKLIMEMTHYYEGQPRRIQHFMKVYGYAKLIGELEGIDKRDQEILEVAAIVHDIGIKKSEDIYGDSAGQHQEELGPAIAEEMLAKFGYDEKLIQRVSYLVGHHHTYGNIDSVDYQILVEADFLVNLFEDDASKESARNALDKIFQTETGREICKVMFQL